MARACGGGLVRGQNNSKGGLKVGHGKAKGGLDRGQRKAKGLLVKVLHGQTSTSSSGVYCRELIGDRVRIAP